MCSKRYLVSCCNECLLTSVMCVVWFHSFSIFTAVIIISYEWKNLLYFKVKYQSTNNTKIGRERGNTYRKNEEISIWKAHINTCKLHWYFCQSQISSIKHWLSSDWEKHLWLSKCISEASVCFSSSDLFIFLVRVSSFFSNFFVEYIFK